MISVIIPNYNHAQFLAERIESVLSQTHKDLECIILDDASTDDSLDIIQSYATKDNRIKYYVSGANSGSPFIQWNKGVGLARHELVWIAESDDTAAPGFLEKLLQLHQENPEIALAYCQSNRVNEKGTITGTWKSQTDEFDEKLFAGDFVLTGMDYISSFLIYKNTIPNASAVLFRKEKFLAAGGADERLRTNSDWLCWLKMLTKNSIAFTSAPLNNFRYHDNSVIAKLKLGDPNKYAEQYDGSMRTFFSQFCRQKNISLPVSILKHNKKCIAFEQGNKGLFQVLHQSLASGMANILRATFYPKPTFGYLRRLLKEEKL